jgi:hypothetical protein
VVEKSDKRVGLKFKLACSPAVPLACGNCLKFNLWLVADGTTVLNPRREIFALTDIKDLELVAALRYGFDTNPGNSNASTDR